VSEGRRRANSNPVEIKYLRPTAQSYRIKQIKLSGREKEMLLDHRRKDIR